MLRFRDAARPRVVLGWALVLLAASQFGLGVFLGRARPHVREPEYGSLLNALRQRLAETPDRPLVLVLGSSRSANLFRPSPPRAPSDPLLFNFATLASGPVRHLQMLRRLLAQGIRPQGLVVEVWPPFLNQRPGFAEEEFIRERDLRLTDAPLLARYFVHPWPSYAKLVEGTLLPAYSYRTRLLDHYDPFRRGQVQLVPGNWADPPLRAAGSEGFGWLAVMVPRPGPAELQRSLARAREYIREHLDAFEIRPVADSALHELLETCTRHAIRPALVLLPEHTAVRDSYPPGVRARVDAYLADVARQEGVPVIDTRGWLSDDEFLDAIHALPQAAGPYTERFGHEVIQPLLEGRPLPPHLPGPSPPPTPPAPVSRADEDRCPIGTG
jgi:hypothetical protein